MSLTDPSRPLREFLADYDRLRSEHEALQTKLRVLTHQLAIHQLTHGPLAAPNIGLLPARSVRLLEYLRHNHLYIDHHLTVRVHGTNDRLAPITPIPTTVTP